MAFDGVPLFLFDFSDPNRVFSDSSYSSYQIYSYFTPPGIGTADAYTVLSILAYVGSAPNILGYEAFNPYPQTIGTWHEAGTVTLDMVESTQMRLSHTGGTNLYYSGPSLGAWHDATNLGFPAYNWGWGFLKSYTTGEGSLSGTYLLEMRDADTLTVLDSATVTITLEHLNLGSPG